MLYELVRSSLLERERDLEVVEALLEEAARERGRVLVVEGPPGIGKTLLAHEVQARAAAADFEAATARSSELERDFPFGVVRQLFEPILATGETRGADAVLSGTARFAETAFGDDVLCGGAAPEEEASYATVHGVYALAAKLAARKPLLIAVDDAQWADDASLRCLAYLTKRIDALHALVVVTVTPGELDAERRLLREIVGDPLAAVLRLTPLSKAAVEDLLREWLRPDAEEEFCNACFEATQGNPFLLRELVAQLASEGVEPNAEHAGAVPMLGAIGASASVLARVSRIGRDATLLARAVAVLGDEVERGAAAALAGLADRRAAAAAGALVKVQIFHDAERLGFVHPIVRAAVYSDVDFVDRAAWHAAAAEALREKGGSLDEIAAHLLATRSPLAEWAVEALSDAARRARARGALDEAATYLSRALSEATTLEHRRNLLHTLGSVELHALRASGFDHLKEALELTDDPIERAKIALELGRALALSGRPREAVAVLERGRADAGEADSALGLKLEAELLGAASADLASTPLARERLAELRNRVTAGKAVSPGGLSMLALGMVASGEAPAEGVRLAKRAFGEEPLFTTDSSRQWGFAIRALTWADELELAGELLGKAVDEARDRGSMLLSAFALSLRADVAYRRGEVADAETDARASLEAVEQDARQEGGWKAPAPIAPLLSALIERGALDEADALLAEAGLSGTLPEVWRYNLLLEARGRLRVAQGQLRDGLADLLECGRRLELWGVRNPAVAAWRSAAALAFSALGQHDEARRLAAEEVKLSRGVGAARALGIALRAFGLTEHGDRRARLLREAAATLEGSPAKLEYARSLTDLAAALGRRPPRSEVRELLRGALSLARNLGATALAERAHDQLVATGARPRRAVTAGPAALTAREHRVTRLAKEGHTNREIARTLFVTEKTVELHLSNAYHKLGIRSRTQLGRALDSEGQEVSSEG